MAAESSAIAGLELEMTREQAASGKGPAVIEFDQNGTVLRCRQNPDLPVRFRIDEQAQVEPLRFAGVLGAAGESFVSSR